MGFRIFLTCLAIIFANTWAWGQDADTFVLELQGLEPGIDVIINGKQLGFTPFSQQLPRGEIMLELRHPDWEPYSEIIPPPTKKKLVIKPQLIHSRPYELKSLKEAREHMAASLEEKRRTKGTWDTVGNISLGTLGGGVLVVGTSAVAIRIIDPQYNAATTSQYHSQIDGWNTTLNVGLCIGIAGAIGGIVTLIFSPELDSLQAQIDSIDRQIRTLEVPQ